MKLTKANVSKIAVPQGKNEIIAFDTDVPGFGLRVRVGGSATWIFQYRQGNKQRRLSLGAASAISAQKARERASELHARVRLGEDPGGEKIENRIRAVETFGSVLKPYLMHKKLYTDQDEVLFDSCRPIILNGIEDFITRPDLADRTMFEALQAIPEKDRKASQQLMAEFERERPKILGALLDAVSCGLKRLPSVKLERLPRMADFAKWATACEPALWPAETFATAYDANRAEAVETVIESDAVATALRSFIADRLEWSGTASDLLGTLSLHVPEQERRSKLWPTAPNKLSGGLRRITPFLRQIGIRIDDRRIGKTGTRTIYIRREERVGNPSSAPSGPSAKGNNPPSANGLAADDTADDQPPADDHVASIVSPNPLKNKVADDTDGADDKIPHSSLCAHCGQPGGEPWDWLGQKVLLHPDCADAWAMAQGNQRLRVVTGSSLTEAGASARAQPAGIDHSLGPPLAPGDDLTIPTFLQRGHADCVLGSSLRSEEEQSNE